MTILRTALVIGFSLFCSLGLASEPTRSFPPFGIDFSSQFVSGPALQPLTIKITVYADHPVENGVLDVTVSVLGSEENSKDQDALKKPMRGLLRDANIAEVWVG